MTSLGVYSLKVDHRGPRLVVTRSPGGCPRRMTTGSTELLMT
jgi:hypothetical protein